MLVTRVAVYGHVSSNRRMRIPERRLFGCSLLELINAKCVCVYFLDTVDCSALFLPHLLESNVWMHRVRKGVEPKP